MKKCYIDTNVLIEFKGIAQGKTTRSEKLIIELMLQDIEPVISPLVIDELLHITSRDLDTTNKIIVIKLGLLELLGLPNIHIVNPPTTKTSQLKVIKYMQRYNLKPRDAYHLLTATHNKVDYMATFDNDFNKVFQSGFIKQFKEQ